MRKLLLLLAALVVLAMGYNGLVPRYSPPFDAVYAHAAQQGWEREQLSTLGAGYSSNFLSWKAYGRFRTVDDRELYVAVVKPTPFTDWRLSEVRLTRQ